MSSILAKIVYPSGGGTTLTFVYPARNVAYYDGEPTRYDARSNSGIHVSTLSRVDHFLKFNMPFIAAGADAAAWQAFLDWAAAGAAFDFYPDHTSGSYTTYWQQPGRRTLAYRSPGMYKLDGYEAVQQIT